MPRKPGTPETGGRQKGTPNKATARTIAGIAQSGLAPLVYLLQVLQNERNKTDELIRRIAETVAASGPCEPGENGGQPGLTNQSGSDGAVSTGKKQEMHYELR